MPAQNLFTPLTLGRLSLSHRVVMPPLTRMRAEHGNAANAMMAEYYGQRATQGGFIIGEASQISPDGRGLPCTPGIHTPEQIAGWKLVVDAVHAKGGKIFLQLWHMGRLSHPSHLDGAQPVGPSAIAAQGEALTADYKRVPFPVPRALEIGEIPGLIERYAQAARNALAAGFGGVEIHAANGYLLDSSCCRARISVPMRMAVRSRTAAASCWKWPPPSPACAAPTASASGSRPTASPTTPAKPTRCRSIPT